MKNNNTAKKEEISRLRQKVSVLSKERAKLEAKILKLGPMMEGSLLRRYTRCKKPGCSCEKGKPHGPYFAISGKVMGKTKLIYLAKGKLYEISSQLKENSKFRRLRGKIRKINVEILELLGAYGKIQREIGRLRREKGKG